MLVTEKTQGRVAFNDLTHGNVYEEMSNLKLKMTDFSVNRLNGIMQSYMLAAETPATSTNTTDLSDLTTVSGDTAKPPIAFALSTADVLTKFPTQSARVARDSSDKAVDWWLRNPAVKGEYLRAGIMTTQGAVSSANINWYTNDVHLRPAVYVDLKSKE